MFFILSEFIFVNIYYQQGALLVIINKFVIVLIQFFKIIKADIFFIFTATFLYLANQGRDRAFEVDQQIRGCTMLFSVSKNI